jgi:DNA (cytosine-5)-methyltransferase 1
VKKGNEKILDNIYSSLSVISSKNSIVLSVKDAIFKMPKLFPLKENQSKDKNISHALEINSNSVNHHVPRFHNKRDVDIFKKWIEQEMNKKTTKEKIDFYYKNVGKTSNHNKYRNLEWDKPSPTIVAHLSKDGLMFIHPDKNQARSITLKEAALLQSFPDDYDFIGNYSVCFKMVGNAVPPRMAKEIANVIYKELNG